MAIACDVQSLENNSRCFICVPLGLKPVFDISLLVGVAGASTNPQTLLSQSVPYQFLSGITGLAAEVYLLALLAKGSTDPSTLANAASCFVCRSGGELADIDDYLYAVAAGGSTNPLDLIPGVAKYQTLFGFESQVRVYLTNQWAVNSGVIGSVSPQTLANLSRCFLMCGANFLLQSIKAYLLCQIQSGGGSAPCAPLNTPNAVSATDQGAGNVLVVWSDHQAGNDPTTVTDFTVSWGTTMGGPYPNSVKVIDNGVFQTTVNVAGGQTWFFIVTANFGANCHSAASAEASVVVAQSGSQLATNWASRVVTNGGAQPSNTSINAYAALWDGLVTDGISGMIKHLNGLVNDSGFACVTPFIVGTGNDPWVARCGTAFFGTFDLTVNGLKPTGGNTVCMDTGIQDATAFSSDNDGGMTLYVFSSGSESPRDCGYDNDALTNSFSLVTNAGGLVVANCRSQITGAIANNPGFTQGYFSMNRTANTTFQYFIAASGTPHAVGGSSAVAESGTRQAQSIFFAGTHAIDHGAACTGFTTPSLKRYSFFAIHNGFTQAQSLLFFNRIQTFRTSIGGGFV